MPSTTTSLKDLYEGLIPPVGETRRLFVIGLVAQVLTLILALCPTMNLSALFVLSMRFSFISVFTTADQVGQGLGFLEFIVVVGIIALAASIVLMVLPFFQKRQVRHRNLTLAKVASVYSLAVNALLIIVLAAATKSSSDGLGTFSLTFAGWFYLIAALVGVVCVFIVSSNLKKFQTAPHWRAMASPPPPPPTSPFQTPQDGSTWQQPAQPSS